MTYLLIFVIFFNFLYMLFNRARLFDLIYLFIYFKSNEFPYLFIL